MPEPRDARSLIQQAEQAAGAGNYASAEDLLREAAAIQEQTLGPHHPDLVNTLNNLGVVCERTNNPIDAEHYLRRAYAIATETLPPDHSFVVTTRKNLHEFCAARGRPVELPPSPPQVAPYLDAPAPRAAPARESSPPAAKLDVTPVTRKRSLRPLAVGALSAVALLIVILTMVRPGSGPVEEAEAPQASAVTPAPETPAPETPAPAPTPPPAPARPPAEPIAQPQPTAPSTQATRGEAEAVTAKPATPTGSAAVLTVATAQLCAALDAWRCQAADSQVSPGPMFFYTQVKSATATTIEHRWYQGDRMMRAVPLRIEANPAAGYRTYSRITISGERVGDWRVELRGADGTVLHEERFTVR